MQNMIDSKYLEREIKVFWLHVMVACTTCNCLEELYNTLLGLVAAMLVARLLEL